MSAWKADALPLGHTRILRTDFTLMMHSGQAAIRYLIMQVHPGGKHYLSLHFDANQYVFQI
jgi:hypothetical protein